MYNLLLVMKLKTTAIKIYFCEVKIFTLKRYNNPKDIHINNQVILWNKKDDAVKYLGVHLDEKLTWKIHINKKLVQGNTRMRTLYPLVNYKSSHHSFYIPQ